MPVLPDATAFELAPDWTCEVLSPSTAATDRADKMPIYAREQVGHVWLVDSLARTLEACRLESGRWVLLGTWRDDASGSSPTACSAYARTRWVWAGSSS
jgi:Uma2 family endonuclease